MLRRIAVAICVLAGCSSAAPGTDGPDCTVGCDGAPPECQVGCEDAGPGDDAAPIEEISVCSDETDYPTIGSAIAAAASGAVIEVCPGVYPEHLVIDGTPLTIVATGGAAATVIDGGGNGRVLSVTGVGGAGVNLVGFTIRNGAASSSGGGGIACRDATLRLFDSDVVANRARDGAGLDGLRCTVEISGGSVRDNLADQAGGGARLTATSGGLSGVVFSGNQARYGGGLSVSEGDVTIADNTFDGNTATLQGGGLHHGSDAAIRRNRFEGNSSGWTGGGVYLDGHGALFEDNEVVESYAENDGGGIYVHQATAILRANLFSGNVSNDDGGGIRIFESALLVEGNRVENNYAVDSGGGIRVSHVPTLFVDNQVVGNSAGGVGGGFDLDNDSSVISGGVIEDNTAGGSGGGIHAWLFPWQGARFERVRIAGNRAWRGGGLYLQHNYETITLRDLEIVDNVAGHGGGLAIRTSSFVLSHSVLAGNRASNEGGAISIGEDQRPFSEPCGELEELPCPPTEASGAIRFIVADGNQAAEGASIYARSPSLEISSAISVTTAGTVGAITIVDDPPVWQYNDVFGGSFSGMADPTGTGGNLASDPLFVNAEAGDYTLQAPSECVDAGDPLYVDVDGSRADMGTHGGLGGVK